MKPETYKMLLELCHTDSAVYAALRTFEASEDKDVERFMSGLVQLLSQQKQEYSQQAVDMANKQVHPLVFAPRDSFIPHLSAWDKFLLWIRG